MPSIPRPSVKSFFSAKFALPLAQACFKDSIMTMRMIVTFGILCVCFSALGAEQNPMTSVRRAPPPGVPISASDRAALESGVEKLGKEIADLRTGLKSKPELLDLLSDVEIYLKAVEWPLRYDEFLRTNDSSLAKTILQQGLARAEALRTGHSPWASATGLVVRGYRSKIDGSVQPYGLVVPPSFHPSEANAHRLDVWLHGRDNNLTELKFISDRQRNAGEFTPRDAFVLHVYGRYCNAFKFAGEVDVLEALDHARKHYPIDENRIAVRGFSMGGAGCWHLAAHHAGIWAAAAPGAGFAETPEYTKALSREPKPAWYEQKLWHLYDATDYALNLFNCPTVAYSGEIDKQKQAADIIAKALSVEGIELTHIIGPNTEHRYHPQAKEEVKVRVDEIVEQGRDPVPRHVRFETWTLRYNQMRWVTIDGLEKHWDRARVDAAMNDRDNLIDVTTINVSALTLTMHAGLCPLNNTRRPIVALDGQKIEAPAVLSDRSWAAHFQKIANQWRVSTSNEGDAGLRKRHGLQGPIDDAFLDRFIFVKPTGSAWNEKVGAWTTAQQARAIEQWRAQFRGEVLAKNDEDVTPEDIASSSLILWGDPGSNHLLARILDQMPIRWDKRGVAVGEQQFATDHHVPILIYPNPLNPKRYIVINCGFTFAEVGHLSNALQTPKLPDFAVVDVSAANLNSISSGVVAAGFFDENWKLLPLPK